jgi:hypothetical protein
MAAPSGMIERPSHSVQQDGRPATERGNRYTKKKRADNLDRRFCHDTKRQRKNRQVDENESEKQPFG